MHFVKMMLLCLGVKSLDQAGTKRSLSGCAVLSVVPGEKLADPKIDSRLSLNSYSWLGKLRKLASNHLE